MAHNHESHFIPSPFKVVTQYENAFVKSWNEGIAQAMADVLKYIAKATADAIKTGLIGGVNLADELEEDSEVQKARNAGDLHPNGKWVWTEYNPGHFDWRVIKKTASSSAAPQSSSQKNNSEEK